MFPNLFRKCPARLRVSCCLVFAAVAVVAGTLAPAQRAAAVVQRNPEDLLIVDCLLPGQVRIARPELGVHECPPAGADDTVRM